MKKKAIISYVLIVAACFLFISCGDDDDDSSSTDNDESDDAANDDVDDDASDDDDINDDADDDTIAPGCQSEAFLNFDLREGQRNIPYPSDLFTVEGGIIALGEQVVTYLDEIFRYAPFIKEALNTLDGFGLSTPIWFPSNAAPDEELLPDSDDPGAGDTIFCLVVGDELDPHKGQYWPLDVQWIDASQFIRVAPHLPFAEKTTYACVVTDKLLTAEGDCYERPEHLRYILAQEPDENHPDASVLEAARLKMAPYVDGIIESAGLGREEIVGLSIFTTQSITSDMLSIRAQLEEMAQSDPPQVGAWELVETPGGDVDSVWEARYDTVGWRHDGIFVRDENGHPIPGEAEEILLRLNLPAPGVGDFEQPYPVILYGHGMNSELDESMEVAEFLCGQGFAVVAINWAWHGARGPGLDQVLRSILFFNVLSPRHMRDNFRQGVADTIWLKHVLRGLGDLDLSPHEHGGDGEPDLDVEHLVVFGQSVGGIHDGVLAAVEPDFDATILYVPAAEFRTIALESGTGVEVIMIVDLIEMLTPLNVKKDILIALDLMFTVVDAADPYAWGRYVFQESLYERIAPPNILEMMAAYDDTIGAPGSAQMARGLGLTQLEPIVWEIEDLTFDAMPFVGPAVVQYDTDDHGFFEEINDIGVAAHRQAAHFYRTAVESGIATIIDGFEE